MEKRDRLLYQYKNSTNFKNFLDNLFIIVESTSPINLINYLDIDSAEGDWLTQLANMFNVGRVYSSVGVAFLLDYSLLDDDDLLDGGGSPIGDISLRALLKARILRNTAEVKSIDYIYLVFNTAINPTDIEIIEGIKELTIKITMVGDSEAHRVFLGVTSVDDKWFGCPTATGITYDIILT